MPAHRKHLGPLANIQPGGFAFLPVHPGESPQAEARAVRAFYAKRKMRIRTAITRFFGQSGIGVWRDPDDEIRVQTAGIDAVRSVEEIKNA